MWKYSINSVSIGVAIALNSGYQSIAQAQINPDDSLGSESSTVVPDNINGIPSDRLEGGATRGANLFHSFQDFNVEVNRGAYFANPDGINNIFSRVTGANISQIGGTLGVLGNANLFLINPNGILFGANSSLDLRGSFFASSAESLLFDDFAYSTSNPQAPPLLEINIPIGLNFRDNSGVISNQSTSLDLNGNPVGLQTDSGQSLTLVGGEINFTGGTITAPGGRVELGAVATESVITINEDTSLSFPDNLASGNVSFNNGSRIVVNLLVAGNAGDISITAGDISLDGVSVLDASNLTAEEGNAGNIALQATNNISLVGSGILSNIGAEAQGNVGEIVLSANSISFTEGSQLQAGFFAGGQGNGTIGKITIRANDGVIIDNSIFFANNEAGVIADSSDIEINARTLSISNGTQLKVDNFGQGNAGNIILQASDDISFDNSTLFTTNDGVGDAGNVIINAMDGDVSIANTTIFSDSTTGQSGDVNIEGRSLLLTDNSNIGGFATNRAGAGNVSIQTTDFVTLDQGSNISVFSSGSGTGGSVAIDSAQLNLLNESGINAFVFGDQPAGTININTTDTVTISGESSLLLNTNGNGDAGSLELNTGTLTITEGSQISSSTFAAGTGGRLNISATDTIEITGTTADGLTVSRIDASTSGSGKGGDIQVDAKNLIISEGSAISSFATIGSSGQGGNITVNVDESIKIDGFRPLGFLPSSIDAESNGTGNAGNININTSNLAVSNGAEVNSSTTGEGTGGNISILATDSLTVSGFIPNTRVGSQIASQSITSLNQPVGNAGNITISTPNLLVRDAGQITVSSIGTATAGNLEINADLIELDSFGILNAQTFGGEGNIILSSKDIFLRGESNITTNAFGSSTGGGNITIDTENLVAFPNENSDISANAEDSFGGQVSITAKGIFGTEFRDEPTPQSDITATSELGAEFNGEVAINTPEVDPTSGLINLPASVGDASDKISQNPCEQGVGSEFIVTGKGGLPPNVNESLNSESAQVGLIEPLPQRLSDKDKAARIEAIGISTDNSTPEVVPAMGWVFNDQGEVTLTAYSTSNNQIQRSGQQHQTTCTSGLSH